MKIEIKGLRKDYGSHRALEDIHLTLGEGMHGLLGPNGAGKTTLMRILATLLPKTAGEVTFDGVKVEDRREIRRLIGYLPQEFSFYPNFTVYETLDYFAALSKLKLSKHQLLEQLEMVNLQQLWKTKTKALSGGMKRRLGIAVALVGSPAVLMVDEPTAGLDPEERIRVRNMLSQLGKTKTILFSTHIVEDIAMSCKSLSILNQGRLAYHGTVEGVIQGAGGWVWSLEVDAKTYEAYQQQYPLISSTEDGDRVALRILSKARPSENAVQVAPTLEDGYMKVIKEVALGCSLGS